MSALRKLTSIIMEGSLCLAGSMAGQQHTNSRRCLLKKAENTYFRNVCRSDAQHPKSYAAMAASSLSCQALLKLPDSCLRLQSNGCRDALPFEATKVRSKLNTSGCGSRARPQP